MKIPARMVFVVLLLAAPIRSAEAHPHLVSWMKHHKVFVAASAAIFAASAADAVTSIHALERCLDCTEANPFLGQHPSSRTYWSVSIASSAMTSVCEWYGERISDDYGFMKPVARTFAGAVIVTHVVDAYANSTRPSSDKTTAASSFASPH